MIDLSTLTAVVETRLANETDSGGTPWPYIVLRFGEADVYAWPLDEDDAERYDSVLWDDADRRRFVENFVADKLRAILTRGRSA